MTFIFIDLFCLCQVRTGRRDSLSLVKDFLSFKGVPLFSTGTSHAGQTTPTHSDGLAHMEWEKEIEHSVRIAKMVLSHLTSRHPELFQMKDVPWYETVMKRKCVFIPTMRGRSH